ncbi:DUF7147 family protein [Macrococcus armenti]|uniref:DUF7147 family protein n=1 Tax=Macrococcus armenti TaxID=2875764 RepID=UPI001CCE18DC|nr:hypothetical protein [Macrococcus armenti]UBH09437.1 hypothetical protein LAU41_04490 [Macrococcus armenti]UBH11730.1 hypothetical protein LAU38_04480 [Macrococcus armenti]UBH16202.1 hypothetical protein LAU44_04430 [Macrococcus armenti]UBH18562.1 hypothetical protein LAU39_04440 [Macrococcus armenti]UBH20829.1 hypothetical protein LAU40_04430 [Macrococcus armenti]
MKQTFIPLGSGLSDLFEFEQLMKYNHERIHCLLFLHTTLETEPKTSCILIMQPANDKFQAMYSIFECIKYPYNGLSKKYELLKGWAETYGIDIKEHEIKSKQHFYEDELYYQYLTGVLRLQRIIPPMY